MENGHELWTCPIQTGVLGGTYRKRVLESIKDVPNLKLIEKAPEIKDISEWKEAFLTNAYFQTFFNYN